MPENANSGQPTIDTSKLPNNHVLAVLSGNGALERLQRELREHGFDSAVLTATEMEQEVDPKGERSGPLAALLKAVQDHLSEEQNYLAQYQEEARSGKTVLAVPVTDRDAADDARQVLEQFGAQNVRFFGLMAVHDLTPESNPSTRSAESPERWSQA